MASRCALTGKGTQHGRRVSDSLRRTPHVWKPNLQKKTFVINGQKVRLMVSTSALRTLKKKNAVVHEIKAHAKATQPATA